jgi:hypothetical protein
MRPHHYTLDRRHVHKAALDLLQEHVPIRDRGSKATARVFWSVLLVAAARLTSIHAACRQLRGAPSDEALRRGPPTRPSTPPCPTSPRCSAGSTTPWPGGSPGPCAARARSWPST